MTGSDILDNFSDVAARIGTLSDEETAQLTSDVIAEVVSRKGDVTDHQIGNLKSLFATLASKPAQSLWTAMLAAPESKKVAMPWQNDAEFCALLRSIYGLASKAPATVSAESDDDSDSDSE